MSSVNYNNVSCGNICKDGDVCSYWICADGSVVCRHGLCAEGKNETSVDFKCPAELQYNHEMKEWNEFWKKIPEITRELKKKL